MKFELLKYKKIRRKKFEMENYCPDYSTLVIVQEGSFDVCRGNTEYTVSENEAFLFREDVAYVRHVISPVTIYEYRFVAEDAVGNWDKITFQDTERLKSTLSLLDKLDNARYRSALEYRKHLFSDILTQVAIETEEAMYNEGVFDIIVSDAISHMNRYLSSKIVLSDLAKRYGFCYVQFARRFKAATGESPLFYLTSLRLQKAKMLLSENKFSVKKIAKECGFEDEYYFSRVFKKYNGMTPSAYRSDAE